MIFEYNYMCTLYSDLMELPNIGISYLPVTRLVDTMYLHTYKQVGIAHNIVYIVCDMTGMFVGTRYYL